MGNKYKSPALALVVLGLLASLLAGCGAQTEGNVKEDAIPAAADFYVINGERYHILGSSQGFVEKGAASWYGQKYHGRKTSSGEIYNMHEMTAAHKTLPLQTWVRVTNLDNKKAVNLRINDRGPFAKGRIIDVSYAGAQELGMVGSGTAPVLLEALGQVEKREYGGRVEPVLVQPQSYEEGNFAIQIGSFQDRKNAEALMERMKLEYGVATIQIFDRGDAVFFRVQVADVKTIGQAMKLQAGLERIGFKDCFVVAR
ncbi:MAG: septal ring lytic transglycosylase RlpA family protein [Pseudomonadota bacterium]